MRLIILISAFSLSLAMNASANPKTHDEAQRYGEILQAALTEIGSTQNRQKVREQMQELIRLSKVLNKRFSERHTECKDYLNKALSHADRMPDMTLEEIEKDYHADGALPKASGLCHHAKDLLVHPATVLILLKSEDGKVMSKALAELTELNSHLTLVRSKVTK